MATQIKPDGTETEVRPKNGSDFSLDELYLLTGCDCIDVVTTASRRLMIVDDNGLAKNLPYNEKATRLYGRGDTIVGTVLLCNLSEVQ